MKNNTSEIIDLIYGYLEHLDFIVFEGTILVLIEELEEQEEYYFARGDCMIWAASLIYTMSKEHGMNNSDETFALDLDSICAFFKVNKNTVSDKSSKLSKEIEELGLLEEDLSSYLFAEDDYEVQAIILKIEFDIILKVPEEEFESNLNDVLLSINLMDIHPIYLLYKEIKGNTCKLILEGEEEDLMGVVDDLEEKCKIVNVEILDRNLNLFSPPAHYVEFMETYTLMGISDVEFNDIDDFFDDFEMKSEEEKLEFEKQNPEECSEINALKLFELPKEDSINGAKGLITKHPNTIEAYICLAGWEIEDEKRIDLLQDAVEAGEKKLNIELLDKEKAWWLDYTTRPYMRALHILAETFIQADYLDDGIEVFEEILKKNPNDNLGARYSLLKASLKQKKWKKIKAILDLFPEETDPIFCYGKAFYYYYNSRIGGASKRALKNAFNYNNIMVSILLEDFEEGIIHKSDTGNYEEALDAFDMVDYLLSKDKKLLDWFISTYISHYKHEGDFGNDNVIPLFPN